MHADVAPSFLDSRHHFAAIIGSVLRACDPAVALRRSMGRSLAGLDVAMLAAGKASTALSREFFKTSAASTRRSVVLGPPGTCEALQVVVPVGNHRVFDVDHPLPTARNVAAAGAAADLARWCATEPQTRLVVLLSGGASSHLSLPAVPVTLGELCDITRALLRAGADICELNTVRKHLEVLKGGGLARLADGVHIEAFVLSDVIGDDLATIASGPVSADATTFADAMEVLRRFGLEDAVPAVTTRIRLGMEGRHRETIRPGDPVLDTVRCTIIGSNALARQAAGEAAASLGFRVIHAAGSLVGEARLAGRAFAQRVRELALEGGPVCLIHGGETTVRVTGAGNGGRNQEFAVAAAEVLDGVPRACVASFATDGVDGPTDSAGGVVTGETAGLSRARGHELRPYLTANDCYAFLELSDGHIKTGATGTNVCDIAVGMVYP